MSFSSADRSAMGLTLARWGVIGMAASMPISRAIFNLSALMMLMGWLLSGDFRRKWDDLKGDRVAWACVALFAVVVLSAIVGSASRSDTLSQVRNYSKLLYVPLIVSLVSDPSWNRRAWTALLAGLGLTLAVVWLDVWFDIPGTRTYGLADAADKGVFYHHIAQGMALAFLAAYGLHRVLSPGISRQRLVWLLITVADVIALVFINESRAAQLSVIAALILVVITHAPARWRWPGVALAALAIAALGLGSANMQDRFKAGWKEASSYQLDGQSTSVGARLQAWDATVAWIKEAPVLGHGAGAYRAWAHQHFDGSPICKLGVCEQPHNQFILTTAESGAVGLLTLLAFLFAPLISGKAPRSKATLLYPPLLGIFVATAVFDSSLSIQPQAFFFVTTLGIVMASRGVLGNAAGQYASNTPMNGLLQDQR
jgi:O-antigen ligase